MNLLKCLVGLIGTCLMMSAYAQQALRVNSPELDLGTITETLGTGTKKIKLVLGADTPDEFKLKFKFKYQFVSHELDTIYIGPNGVGGYSTKRNVEQFEGKKTVKFFTSEALFRSGDDLEVLVEISKPNQNTHGLKIKVSLPGPQGHEVNGGRKLLGLLGHSYEITPQCQQSLN